MTNDLTPREKLGCGVFERAAGGEMVQIEGRNPAEPAPDPQPCPACGRDWPMCTCGHDLRHHRTLAGEPVCCMANDCDCDCNEFEPATPPAAAPEAELARLEAQVKRLEANLSGLASDLDDAAKAIKRAQEMMK